MKTKALSLAVAFGLGVAVLGLPGAADADAGLKAQIRSLDLIKESGELHVAVYNNYPPFSVNSNGTLQGIDVDIAKALGKLLGLKVTFKEVPAGDSVDDDLRNAIWRGSFLDHSTADVMLHIPTDPKLSQTSDEVKIFGAYYKDQLAVAGDPDKFDADDGVEAFRDAKVGVELATLADMVLMLTDKGALIDNVRHYRSLEQAVDGMDKGEVVAVMGVQSELEGALGARRAKYPVTVMNLPKVAHSTWELGMAVDAGAPALAQVLSDGIATLIADGTIKKIFADHGVDYVDP
jgi:ABC-type amino acid transport substrate-binding protein